MQQAIAIEIIQVCLPQGKKITNKIHVTTPKSSSVTCFKFLGGENPSVREQSNK